MDMIVDRLCGIETAATDIMEAAALEKKDMEKQSLENLKEYDEWRDQQTAEKLAKLQTALDAQMSKELNNLKANTEKVVQMIEADYDTNHAKLARELLQKVIAR